jgi:hypothetical protein
VKIRQSKKSCLGSRLALSPVISTVILSTTLLIVMIVTTGVANDILRNQMASTEFDSAKNLMKSVVSEINSLVYNKEASAVIKTSFFYTSPGYTETGKIMNVTFTGSTDIFHINQNTMNIESIPGVGGSVDYTLEGSDLQAVPSYLGEFGRLYISKPHNWRVALDYHRVQYTYSGISYLFDGAETVPYNIIEVTGIEMSFTQFDTADSAIIVLKNDGVAASTLELSGNWVMTVTTRDGGSSTVSLTQMGGNAAYPTKLQFNKVTLNVHVLGDS